MRCFTWPMTTLLLTAALSACGGGTTTDAVEPKTTVAVIGDVPYGTGPTDDAQLKANPAFITAMNADADLSVVLHVGDIHSGKEYCTEAYDRAVAAQWSAFKLPVVYTPGDNEWADCHKVKQGGGAYVAGAISLLKDAAGNLLSYVGGDPVANLQLVRSIFFATPGKTSGVAMDVHSQAKEFDTAYPADAASVENVWWMKSKVLFVTLNVPGGSNNDTDVWYGAPTAGAAQALEVATRSAANKRWLDTAFKAAAANGAIGVVIQLQADMWDLDGVFTANAAGQNHLYEYKQFIDKIATNATSFGKPHRQPAQAGCRLRDRAVVRCRGRGLLCHLGAGNRRQRQGRSLREPAARLQRAQLPPHRRAWQHHAAGVPEADDRPRRQCRERHRGVRAVQLEACQAAVTAFMHSHPFLGADR
jgi:hypothetical protein